MSAAATAIEHFCAFKLHRFISGAGHVYATLRGSGQRRVTLDGQRFDPEDQAARLYATFFCRNCGQEYHPVVLAVEDGIHRVLPRDIDDTPLDDPDSAERPGYLMPEPENDAEFTFKGELEDFPEDWLELDRGGAPRLRRDRKAYVPRPSVVPPSLLLVLRDLLHPSGIATLAIHDGPAPLAPYVLAPRFRKAQRHRSPARQPVSRKVQQNRSSRPYHPRVLPLTLDVLRLRRGANRPHRTASPPDGQVDILKLR